MRYNFHAFLSITLDVDDATFGLLEACFRTHYDAKVKACAALGGFMYGARNRRDFARGDDNYRRQLELRGDEFQLLLKAIEMRRHVVGEQLETFFRQTQAVLDDYRFFQEHINRLFFKEPFEVKNVS